MEWKLLHSDVSGTLRQLFGEVVPYNGKIAGAVTNNSKSVPNIVDDVLAYDVMLEEELWYAFNLGFVCIVLQLQCLAAQKLASVSKSVNESGHYAVFCAPRM